MKRFPILFILGFLVASANAQAAMPEELLGTACGCSSQNELQCIGVFLNDTRVLTPAEITLGGMGRPGKLLYRFRSAEGCQGAARDRESSARVKEIGSYIFEGQPKRVLAADIMSRFQCRCQSYQDGHLIEISKDYLTPYDTDAIARAFPKGLRLFPKTKTTLTCDGPRGVGHYIEIRTCRSGDYQALNTIGRDVLGHLRTRTRAVPTQVAAQPTPPAARTGSGS